MPKGVINRSAMVALFRDTTFCGLSFLWQALIPKNLSKFIKAHRVRLVGAQFPIPLSDFAGSHSPHPHLEWREEEVMIAVQREAGLLSCLENKLLFACDRV